MLVQVHHKREQRRLRSSARFSVLGDGLLERARSTTFALLGAVAAVGLAMIAVALQEDWPLIAGSPVPRAPALHASVGRATALGARAAARVAHDGSARRRRKLAAHSDGPASTGGAPVASAPATPAELVASPGTPVESQGGGADGGGSHGTPEPHGQAPSSPQSQQAPSSPAPTAQPSPAPTPPSSPAPAETPPPEATASEAPPVESYTPSWSNGEGHAYGREDDDHGHGHDAGGRAGD